jgi:hypothetical protein
MMVTNITRIPAIAAGCSFGNNKDKGSIIIKQSNIYRTIERQNNANQKKKASDQDTVLLMSLSIERQTVPHGFLGRHQWLVNFQFLVQVTKI